MLLIALALTDIVHYVFFNHSKVPVDLYSPLLKFFTFVRNILILYFCFYKLMAIFNIHKSLGLDSPFINLKYYRYYSDLENSENQKSLM